MYIDLSRALTALPGASPPTQGVKASPAAIHYGYVIYMYMCISIHTYLSIYLSIYIYIHIHINIYIHT